MPSGSRRRRGVNMGRLEWKVMQEVTVCRNEVAYEEKFRSAPNGLVCVGLSCMCDRV
jgi:hypothetical protein